MKKLILLIIASNFVLAYSQEWSAILPNSVSYFSIDSTLIHAVRIDSTSISGDSISYYPFKILRPKNQGKFIVSDNWIGGKITTLSNGYTTFYNKLQKPVFVNTKASLNETWPVYVYPDSSFIEAQIDSIYISSFLGQTDSVKSISLQLKDKYGSPIINESDSCAYINSTILELSKNYGLIKIVEFYNFPFKNLNDFIGSYQQYHLIGMTNPSFGYKKLTSRDFYDYNVGDQFHWREVTSWYFYDASDHIDKVISKVIAPNDSSVDYTFDRITRTSNNQYSKSTFTQTFNYYPSNLWPDHFEPLESNGCYIHSTLIACRIYTYDPAIYDEVYYKNAGYYSSDRGYEYSHTRSLLYYTHGTFSWGTPFEFHPDQVINPDAASDIPVFYPNPASDKLYFRFQNTNSPDAIITIRNVQGMVVLNQHFDANMLDVSNLSPGLYTIRIVESGKVQIKSFLKL